MAGYLVKGILIGIIFGIPVGAVGAMTVQRTLTHGLKAGLLTGLGSSVADCLYAIVGVFGITLASDFLLKYQLIIHAFGGIVLLLIGINLFLKQAQAALQEINGVGNVKLFLSSFVIGVTNPAVILTFSFAFSYFGVFQVGSLQNGIALVLGVFIGTYFWWAAISLAAYKVKQSWVEHSFSHSNKVFGVIIALLGAIVLAKSFFS